MLVGVEMAVVRMALAVVVLVLVLVVQPVVEAVVLQVGTTSGGRISDVLQVSRCRCTPGAACLHGHPIHVDT
jgi:hypothetical protein